jgi:phytoene dehydrogenase-like protein
MQHLRPERSGNPQRHRYDAIVIGSGPNGLSAAVTLAKEGKSVLVVEAGATLGGGARSAELTLPGFVHDICSAIHPMGAASPFFRALPLAEHGLEWIEPPAPLAHPFDDGTAAILERSFEDTGKTLGGDATAWSRLMKPLADHAATLFEEALAPLGLPRHPLLMARLGMRAVWPATWLARYCFRERNARALFSGIAAHSILPLERPLTSAIGVMLGVAGHAVGWPFARSGSQRITDALASYLHSLGGETITGWRVGSTEELPVARVLLFDTVPREMLKICGHKLPSRYRRSLERFRHGPASFKVDWALDGPIPWKAAACSRAATVHLGATMEEIADAERVIWQGICPEKPFVLIAQHTLFDPTRAPAGKHTGWGYCHVPAGSTVDMTERIEEQVERFAPGFRQRILARHVITPADFERYNPSYLGGDITGGVVDLWQTFTRPAVRVVPYSTPVQGIYICSSSTPPGPGVHGMCGYFGARAALRELR